MCPSWQDGNRGDSRAFRLLGSAAVRRVSVVGTSGVGKSTFASALALVLGAAFLELDSVQHQADWTPLPVEEFRARVALVADGECWVIDGNYSRVQDLVWARADTVVWLDLPRRVVMRRIIWRSVWRVAGRTELWNGNRERWRNLFTLERRSRSSLGPGRRTRRTGRGTRRPWPTLCARTFASSGCVVRRKYGGSCGRLRTTPRLSRKIRLPWKIWATTDTRIFRNGRILRANGTGGIGGACGVRRRLVRWARR